MLRLLYGEKPPCATLSSRVRALAHTAASRFNPHLEHVHLERLYLRQSHAAPAEPPGSHLVTDPPHATAPGGDGTALASPLGGGGGGGNECRWRTLELSDCFLKDLPLLPPLPRLQRLVLRGHVWCSGHAGGNAAGLGALRALRRAGRLAVRPLARGHPDAAAWGLGPGERLFLLPVDGEPDAQASVAAPLLTPPRR